MQTIQDAFAAALHLMITLNAGLIEIVLLSLRVSLTAVLCAALIGLPLAPASLCSNFPAGVSRPSSSAPSWACRRWSSG